MSMCRTQRCMRTSLIGALTGALLGVCVPLIKAFISFHLHVTHMQYYGLIFFEVIS